MEQVAHQTMVMQFILELAKSLKVDPRACFRQFFTKIKVWTPIPPGGPQCTHRLGTCVVRSFIGCVCVSQGDAGVTVAEYGHVHFFFNF